MQWRNQSHRPRPITIISVLEFIPGIFAVLIGIIFVPLGWFVPLGFIILLFGISYFVLGILLIIVGHGLYRGKGWAWKCTIIFEAASIGLNILAPVLIYIVIVPLGFNNPGFNNPGFNNPGFNNPGFNNPSAYIPSALLGAIPYIAIAVIILIYMRRPKTRAYFGKVQIDK